MSNVLKYLLVFMVIMFSAQAKNIFTSGENLSNNREWTHLSNKVFTFFEYFNGVLTHLYYVRLNTGLFQIVRIKNSYQILSCGYYRYRNNNIFTYREGHEIHCRPKGRRTSQVRISCGKENVLKRVTGNKRVSCGYIAYFETPLACDAPLPAEVISTLRANVRDLKATQAESVSKIRSLKTEKSRLSGQLKALSDSHNNSTRTVTMQLEKLRLEKDLRIRKVHNLTLINVRMSNQIGDLMSRNARLLRKSVAMSLAHTNLSRERTKLSSQNTKLSGEYTNLSSKYIILSSKYTNLSRERTKLSSQNTKLSGAYANLSSKYINLSSKYTNISSERTKMKRRNVELEGQVQKMSRSIFSAKEDVNRERNIRVFLIALVCAAFGAFFVTVAIALRINRRKKISIQKGEPDHGETMG
eukprot:212988_1